jgi:hypothetical protein
VITVITRRFTRIDLTNATEDYLLKVGEEAYISFNNITTLPLKIATVNDSFYEAYLIPSRPGTLIGDSTRIKLLPNNTEYTNQIVFTYIFRNSNTFNSTFAISSHCYIGAGHANISMWIVNRKQYKNVRSVADSYGASTNYPIIIEISNDWRNTTTEWTSLGTIIFPMTTSGEIIVRRLM